MPDLSPDDRIAFEALWNRKPFDMKAMTKEERDLFFRGSREKTHSDQYDAALEWVGRRDGPKWHDLTPEQRENVRKANQEHQRNMAEIGDVLRGATT